MICTALLSTSRLESLGPLQSRRQIDAKSIPFSEPDGGLFWDARGRTLAIVSTPYMKTGECSITIWPTMEKITLPLTGVGGFYVRWSTRGSLLLVGGGGEAVVLSRKPLKVLRRVAGVMDGRWLGHELRIVRGTPPTGDDLPTTLGGHPKHIGSVQPLACSSNSAGLLRSKVKVDSFVLEYLNSPRAEPVNLGERSDFPDRRLFCLRFASQTLLGIPCRNAYGLALWTYRHGIAKAFDFSGWRRVYIAQGPFGDVFFSSEPTYSGGKLLGLGMRMGAAIENLRQEQNVIFDFSSRTIFRAPTNIIRLVGAPASGLLATVAESKESYVLQVFSYCKKRK